LAYPFRVAGEFIANLIGVGHRQQWRVHDCFARIAADPFAEPDLQLQRNDDVVLVRVFDDTLVYYVEHAVRTVTVVDFEIVQAP
jgi:hypothetical protein